MVMLHGKGPNGVEYLHLLGPFDVGILNFYYYTSSENKLTVRDDNAFGLEYTVPSHDGAISYDVTGMNTGNEFICVIALVLGRFL